MDRVNYIVIDPVEEKLLSRLRSYGTLMTIVFSTMSMGLIALLLLMDFADYGISLVAIGATIFMVFITNSNSHEIRYRTLFGAYLIASSIGYLCFLIGHGDKLTLGIAFMLSITAMLLIKIVHPPAIAFVLAFGMNNFGLAKVIIVLLCVFTLIFSAKSIKYILNNPAKFNINLKRKNGCLRFKFKKKKQSKVLLSPKRK